MFILGILVCRHFVLGIVIFLQEVISSPFNTAGLQTAQ